MIAGKSFCPFSYAAVWGLQSNLAKFRPEFEAAIAAANGARYSDSADLPARPRCAVRRDVAGLSFEEKYDSPDASTITGYQ